MNYLKFFDKEIPCAFGISKTVGRAVPVFAGLEAAIPLAMAMGRALYQGEGVFDLSWRRTGGTWNRIGDLAVGNGRPFPMPAAAECPQREDYRAGVAWRLWDALEARESSWTLSMRESGERLHVALEFDPTRVRLDMLENLLENVLAQISRLASGIPAAGILPESIALSDLDRKRQIKMGTGPEPKRKVGHVVEEFRTAARLYPEAIALKDKRQSFTYARLDAISTAFAELLAASGAVPGDRVVLCLERTAWFSVAAWGVFKAGCTYVAIEPGYPEERIRFILVDTGAVAIVCDGEPPVAIPPPVRAFAVETLAGLSETSAFAVRPAWNLAYILYTSGSTGVPKGVMVSQENLSHFLSWSVEHNPMGPGAITASLTPFIFDVSICELFTPMLQGATLYILARHAHLQNLAGECPDIALICTVPSAFKSLLALRGMLSEKWKRFSIRYLNMAGEALEKDLADKLAARLAPQGLRNCYGPTEATVYATWCEVRPADARMTIGKPLPGLRTYVLGETRAPVPCGFPGELAIAGPSVAVGYLNNAAQTALRFPTLESLGGERVYLTGDEVCLDRNGDLVFHGRKDHQIKLNGYRIEIGEIESRLARLDGVEQAIVFPLEKKGKGLVLAAAWSGIDLGGKELAEALGRGLPDYMVPQEWYHVDAFPVTPSGKADRKQVIARITEHGTAEFAESMI
jgi:amino acid adenylation domain-containing protein